MLQWSVSCGTGAGLGAGAARARKGPVAKTTVIKPRKDITSRGNK